MSYGNLQKIVNGKRRFSITPYIPGGFTSPKTLEKIATVARKYNATIKITSGQRIMIGNLKQEDLDNIWKELEMKPAVTNQYSIKNIELCPAGFCKRSKQNSIGIGMKLINRFYGMQMPNRTKIGVVGCRNSCTSAYSKDIAVVGDVCGYIIAVGGSAGFYPRLPDIIDENLDEENALKLVENILNYYKENAPMGEKLGIFIDRIGIEEFKKGIL